MALRCNPRHIVLACRSAERGKQAEMKIIASLPKSTATQTKVEFMKLDLGDLESV